MAMRVEDLPVIDNIETIAELQAATSRVLRAFGHDPEQIDLSEFADLGLDPLLEMWLAHQPIRLDELRAEFD